jgi:hypothetical protein
MTTIIHSGFRAPTFRSHTPADLVILRRAVLVIATLLVAFSLAVGAVGASHSRAASPRCATATMTSSLPAVDANGNFVTASGSCVTSHSAASAAVATGSASSIAPALLPAVTHS